MLGVDGARWEILRTERWASRVEIMTETPAKDDKADDEMRRRYLEALEHKKAGHGSGAAGRGGDAKASGATANATTQRMFRRKSGG